MAVPREIQSIMDKDPINLSDRDNMILSQYRQGNYVGPEGTPSTPIAEPIQEPWSDWSEARERLEAIGQEPVPVFDTAGAKESLSNVGAYEGYDFTNPLTGKYDEAGNLIEGSKYEAQRYDPYQYDINTDYASMYNAPDAYEAFQFDTPEIAGLERVTPLSQEMYQGQQEQAKKNIARQFGDAESMIQQSVAASQTRPEQVAALMAQLGVDRSSALTEAQQDIAFEQANQELGIAQQEQALEAQRASQQANMAQTTQESQAQELAAKYGYDIDDARYLVELGQKTAEDEFAVQGAKAEEGRYGYESNVDQDRYVNDLYQSYEANKANEGMNAYESQKELATDLLDIDKYGYEAKAGSRYDEANLATQTGSAAGEQFATGTNYLETDTGSGNYADTTKTTSNTTTPSTTGTSKSSLTRPKTTSERNNNSNTGGSYA